MDTRPKWSIGLLLLLTGAWLGVRAWKQWQLDPLMRVPLNDAAVYWAWAGRIASGEWIGTEPFFSAPLYPYLLGLLRALGLGIGGVVVVQILLLLLTMWRVHAIALRFLAPHAAWLAPTLLALVVDTGYGTLRLLNNALSALLVVLLWEQLIRLREELAPGRVARASLLYGLNLLANPIFLPALPLYGTWLWWRSGRRLQPALLGVAVVLLCMSPATLHNRLACGEWIPLSAQGGVTFVHGNAPGADGTYHAIAGVSIDRARQNQDARARVLHETDGSWRATDAAYFREGLAFWTAQPIETLLLFARKLRWFLFGNAYGDIYVPLLEAEAGLDPLRWPGVLPAGLIVPLGLLALFFAWRDRRAGFAELLLVGLPLLTVLLFFYSPRYRFAALVPLCVFAALGLAMLWQNRARDLRGALLALTLGLGAGHGLLAEHSGFDRLDSHRSMHDRSLGIAWTALGKHDEALLCFRRAARAGDELASVAASDSLRRKGMREAARAELEEWIESHPGDAYAHKTLGITLAELGLLNEALEHLELAWKLDRSDPETIAALQRVTEGLESKR
jgi:tetratricopeptide (TPR) repeat protein